MSDKAPEVHSYRCSFPDKERLLVSIPGKGDLVFADTLAENITKYFLLNDIYILLLLLYSLRKR